MLDHHFSMASFFYFIKVFPYLIQFDRLQYIFWISPFSPWSPLESMRLLLPKRERERERKGEGEGLASSLPFFLFIFLLGSKHPLLYAKFGAEWRTVAIPYSPHVETILIGMTEIRTPDLLAQKIRAIFAR